MNLNNLVHAQIKLSLAPFFYLEMIVGSTRAMHEKQQQYGRPEVIENVWYLVIYLLIYYLIRDEVGCWHTKKMEKKGPGSI